MLTESLACINCHFFSHKKLNDKMLYGKTMPGTLKKHLETQFCHQKIQKLPANNKKYCYTVSISKLSKRICEDLKRYLCL